MSEIKDMYENALRRQYRFPSSVGPVTLEDLWDVPLKALKSRPNQVSLDQVARNLSAQLKEEAEESFVDDAPSTTRFRLSEQLELVKHIIAVKKAEQEAAKNAFVRSKERAELLEILHAKKSDELKGLTVEELEKRIADLPG